jgi:hypothetical protein
VLIVEGADALRSGVRRDSARRPSCGSQRRTRWITIVDLPEDRGAALADRIGTRHGPERVDVAVGDLLRR